MTRYFVQEVYGKRFSGVNPCWCWNQNSALNVQAVCMDPGSFLTNVVLVFQELYNMFLKKFKWNFWNYKLKV